MAVVYFATNFLTSVLAGFQKKSHEHQIKEIIELRASLDKRFQKNQLIVKLHPADDPNNYIALRSIKNIKISTTLDLLQIIENSLFCVANFSTVAVQCFRSKNYA